jgi:Holliday junction resolvasome RuvABC endonuclease subunit
MIISIDPSYRSTGIFIYKNAKNNSLYTIDTKGYPDSQVLSRIRASIISACTANGVRYALMEQIMFHKSNFAGAVKIQHACGVITEALYSAGVKQIHDIPVQVWKSFYREYLPKKKTKKYIEAAGRCTAREFRNVDEVDSYLIFRAVQYILSGYGKTESQRKMEHRLRNLKQYMPEIRMHGELFQKGVI